MGFRFYKRIGNKEGWGLNMSGSGLSSSYRTKYGSYSARGFSIRTGIPGLSFRGGWGLGKKKGQGAMIMLSIFVALFVLYIAVIILYNVGIFLIWAGTESYRFILRRYYAYKEKQALRNEASNTNLTNLE